MVQKNFSITVDPASATELCLGDAIEASASIEASVGVSSKSLRERFLWGTGCLSKASPSWSNSAFLSCSPVLAATGSPLHTGSTSTLNGGGSLVSNRIW
eukprot:CAMPEP_0115166592 /NCGR_PEP_ID=MMETSP0227-20121206/74205_1 /TAXON_ID=89957 /ORGANISM="Polarella glacialis, Strain CCMP 1383" /LENGTH=98 /DNA_ID=CAMNT_0002579135 /DNA_START=110 /DNA_END=404 /DNA_ORIENTATION=+